MQVRAQFLASLITLGRILGHHLAQDARQFRIDIGIERTHVGDFRADHFEHQTQRRLVGERHAPGQALEQHDAKRENVGTLIDRLALADLRRQITWRADEFAGGGEFLGEILRGQGNAEVGDLDAAAAADHQVAGLDVAMNHALVVGRGKTQGGFVNDLRGLFGLELAIALEQRAQRFAVDEFHDEIRLAFILADEIDLDDVWIVERGHAARLAQKTFLDAFVVGQRIGQHLDRDIAIQRRFVALVDHAHSTATELGDDVVMPQMLLHDRLHGAAAG